MAWHLGKSAICILCAAFTVAGAAFAAPHDQTTRGSPFRHDCSADPCSSECWCPFVQFEKARLLKFGYGMTGKPKAAAYWYRRAAETGDVRAAFNYGFMLIHGIGGEANADEGFRLLQVAADASISEAWFELGNLHRIGRHRPRDAAEALRFYQQAAERGHVRAQHALANMYGNGQGAGIDLVTAYKWWRLAARKGHGLAEQSLRQVTSMMTTAEISLGKRAAAAWTAKMKRR